MERLKQLLAEPSPENWDAICTELEGVSDEEELREMVAVCEAGLVGWPDGLRRGRESWNGNEMQSAVDRISRLFGIDQSMDIQSYFFGSENFDKVFKSDIRGLAIDYNEHLNATVSCISGLLDSPADEGHALQDLIYIRDFRKNAVSLVWRRLRKDDPNPEFDCEFLKLLDNGNVLAVLRLAGHGTASCGEFVCWKAGQEQFRVQLPRCSWDSIFKDRQPYISKHSEYLVTEGETHFVASVTDENDLNWAVSIDLVSGAMYKRKMNIWEKNPMQINRYLCFGTRSPLFLTNTLREDAMSKIDAALLSGMEKIMFYDSCQGKEDYELLNLKSCEANFVRLEFNIEQQSWESLEFHSFEVERHPQNVRHFDYLVAKYGKGFRVAYFIAYPKPVMFLFNTAEQQTHKLDLVDLPVAFTFGPRKESLLVEFGDTISVWIPK